MIRVEVEVEVEVGLRLRLFRFFGACVGLRVSFALPMSIEDDDEVVNLVMTEIRKVGIDLDCFEDIEVDWNAFT